MAWWAPWRKKKQEVVTLTLPPRETVEVDFIVEPPKPAFSFVKMLDDIMADTKPVPPSDPGLKRITCKACGHQWTTKRHRLGLPIKCHNCHTVWTDEGEVCCENCGRVHSAKRTNCPRCRHARN
jgi:hypothetical protein